MKQQTDIVKLFQNFFALQLKSRQTLKEETLRYTLAHCEPNSEPLQEEIDNADYGNLLKETTDFAKQVNQYRKNAAPDDGTSYMPYQTAELERLNLYQKRSLESLGELRKAVKTTEAPHLKQYFSGLLKQLIRLYKELLAIKNSEVNGNGHE